MLGTLTLLLIAAAAGVAVALQGQFMGDINRTSGTATAMFLTYGTGALLAAVIWLSTRPAAAGLARLPWYAWTAGALGLVIVGGIGYAAPRMGLSRTLIITVAAQLGAALIIEQFGLFGSTARPVDVTKVAGVLLAIAGVWLVVK